MGACPAATICPQARHGGPVLTCSTYIVLAPHSLHRDWWLRPSQSLRRRRFCLLAPAPMCPDHRSDEHVSHPVAAPPESEGHDFLSSNCGMSSEGGLKALGLDSGKVSILPSPPPLLPFSTLLPLSHLLSRFSRVRTRTAVYSLQS